MKGFVYETFLLLVILSRNLGGVIYAHYYVPFLTSLFVFDLALTIVYNYDYIFMNLWLNNFIKYYLVQIWCMKLISQLLELEPLV